MLAIGWAAGFSTALSPRPEGVRTVTVSAAPISLAVAAVGETFMYL